MAEKKKGFAAWWQRLRRRYRVNIISEEHFEEKASLRLSALHLVIVFSSVIIIMVSLTIYLVAFTSLREYIPGYADSGSKKRMLELLRTTDSLENKIKATDIFLENIQLAILGKKIQEEQLYVKDTASNFKDIRNIKSKEDSLLRIEVEKADFYNVSNKKKGGNKLTSFLFFSPLRGMITDSFDKKTNHFGVDIAAKKNEAVKSVLDGTVMLDTWTPETGHVIMIQHADNLVSVYKHNALLLKKSGAFVKAGEPIAIVGNSGELSTGPHLHFELWYNGSPLNPEEFISF
jgi:murein DD-endopeptidase MepM/ murein hydrolase activator NlpD